MEWGEVTVSLRMDEALDFLSTVRAVAMITEQQEAHHL